MSWKSKHTQVVDTLRSLLLGGEWTDALPGYRTLEQLLGVSRPTIEKALAELTSEGLVAEAETGKSRKILARSLPSTMPYISTKALLILSPASLAEQSRPIQYFIDLVLNSAREEGWDAAFDHFPFQHFNSPAAHLERLMKTHHPDRVLVLGATREVARWLQAREVPFFTLGGAVLDLLDTGIQGCGTDRAKIAAIGAGHLVSKGHSRILYPTAPMHRHAKDRQVDLALEWGTGLTRRELDRLIPIRQSAAPEAVDADWRKWLRKLEPTAVMVQYHGDLLSLIWFCNKAGIRIPEDLSIITLSWEPSAQWMNPPVTGIEISIEALAKWAARWLRLPLGEGGGWRWFEGTLRPGGTVAALRPSAKKAPIERT